MINDMKDDGVDIRRTRKGRDCMQRPVRCNFRVAVVKDSQGNECSLVANESCDIVQVSGLYDKFLQPANFEAELYHLKEWCDEKGLYLREREESVLI